MHGVRPCGSTVLSVGGLCAAALGSLGYVVWGSRVMLLANLVVLVAQVAASLRERRTRR